MSLAHANQLPHFRDFKSRLVTSLTHVSSYIRCQFPGFTFTFTDKPKMGCVTDGVTGDDDDDDERMYFDVT